MKRNLPILKNHDPDNQIGTVEIIDGNLHVSFLEGEEILIEDFYKVFGDCSFTITCEIRTSGKNKKRFVKKATIYEFSFCAYPKEQNEKEALTDIQTQCMENISKPTKEDILRDRKELARIIK